MHYADLFAVAATGVNIGNGAAKDELGRRIDSGRYPDANYHELKANLKLSNVKTIFNM